MSTNLYPFTTKKSIMARLATDPAYRNEVMVQLYHAQTYREQCTNSTIVSNKVGFMSSHSVHGSRIAKKLIAGETLTAEDQAKVDAIAPRYSRQIALFMRAEAIAANPELAEVAKTFSANNVPTVAAPPVSSPEETATEEFVDGLEEPVETDVLSDVG
jgi:hypothetical protein